MAPHFVWAAYCLSSSAITVPTSNTNPCPPQLRPTHASPSSPRQLSLIPCDKETCDFFYRLGQLDARFWAETTGVAQAAAAAVKKGANASAAALPLPLPLAPPAPPAPATSGGRSRFDFLPLLGLLRAVGVTA